MDRKALLACLGLGALVFAVGGCSDAGDPHFPAGQSANATITVMDHVGDWDNLVVQGEMTDADGVAMTQDGVMWSAELTGLQPGTYSYDIVSDDGTKALVDVMTDLTLEVDADYQVSGDDDVMIEPSAGSGFNLVVENFDPTYVNIKIKGSMNAWTPDITGHSEDMVYWYLHFGPGDVAPGSYEWGVIEDDGSEWGIWLLPGSNLTFDVDEGPTAVGTLTFVIEEPAPITQLTLNCDLTAYEGTITAVGASGAFDNWADPPTTILTDPDEDGIYSVTIDVEQDHNSENDPANPYQFKFRLNGEWEPDVPAECGVDDGVSGHYNRIVDVFDDPVVYTAAYNACPE